MYTYKVWSDFMKILSDYQNLETFKNIKKAMKCTFRYKCALGHQLILDAFDTKEYSRLEECPCLYGFNDFMVIGPGIGSKRGCGMRYDGEL